MTDRVSIIKELLENSIDAGADSITVEIKNGGKSYIRVTDNGCGINAGERFLLLLAMPRARSLKRPIWMQYRRWVCRGEALASICAVARVNW
ncbi:MAG: ATP-binding protein [Anaerovoracaceae bacterium]